MRVSKPQPRVFTEPRHLIWIKYFEGQSKPPKLQRGAPYELSTIFSQIIHPSVPKSQIYEPVSVVNSDNEEYLLDILDLKSPISPAEISLVKYARQNPQILSKPFKILNIIGNTIVRSIIKFLIQFNNALDLENPDDFLLLYSVDDSCDIYWVMVHLPKPYKSDIKVCLSFIFNNMPTHNLDQQKLFNSQYLREFEAKAFDDSFSLISYDKIASPFYTSMFRYLVLYTFYFISNIGKVQMSENEIKSITKFLNTVSEATQEFINNISTEILHNLIDAILLMFSNIRSSENSCSQSELMFLLGCGGFTALINLLKHKYDLIEYSRSNKNFKTISLFSIWCFKTFQDENNLPNPENPFEIEKTSEKDLLVIDLYSRGPDQTPVWNETNTVLQEIQQYEDSTIENHAQHSLALILKLLKLINNRQAIDSITEFQTEIIQSAKYSSDKNQKDINGKYGSIYAFYVCAYIQNSMIFPFTHFVRDLLLNDFIFDYSIDSCKMEEHKIRTYTRNQIFNVFIKVFQKGSKYSSDILNTVCKYMLDSHLHICDEIIIFLYTIFHKNPKEFMEKIIFQDLVESLTWYGMALQKSPYTLQRNRFISFLTIMLKNEIIRTNFLKTEDMTAFLFHQVFDVELHMYYSELISESFKNVSKKKCFSGFCKVLHVFLSEIVKNTDKKLQILTYLFSRLVDVFEQKKQILHKFIVQNNIILDIINIIKILKTDGLNCAIKLLKVLSFIILDDQPNREKLNRYNYDLYDYPLAFYHTDPQNMPELIDILLFFVFEKQTVITGDLNSYFIKNPESLIMLHNATLDKPSHAGILAFIHCLMEFSWANCCMISASHFIDELIIFFRNNIDSDSQALKMTGKILITQFKWDFKSRYFFALFSDHKSENYLLEVLKLCVESLSTVNSSFDNYIVLTGMKSIITVPSLRLRNDSKGFAFSICFRIDRSTNKHTLCTFITDFGDTISLYISQLNLMYMNPSSAPIKTSKTLQTQKWYNLVVNLAGSDLMILLDGEEIVANWETVKFGKENSVKVTIGALPNTTMPCQMSISSFHMFSSSLTPDVAHQISSIKPSEMQTKKDFSELAVFLNPFHYREERLMNQVPSKQIYAAEFSGMIINNQNIHTAILHTNGIIRALRLCRNSNEITFVIKMMRMLIASSKSFTKSLFQVMPIEKFASLIAGIDPNIFSLDSARELEAIWSLLNDSQHKFDYFKHIMFNFKLWMTMDSSIIYKLFETTQYQTMRDFPVLTQEILNCQYFFSFILICDNFQVREMLWKIMFQYLSLSISKADKESIVLFAKNAPEKLALEFLLRLFGILDLNQETSKILWKLNPEILIILIFRLIYLIEHESTRQDAVNYITLQRWKGLANAFLDLTNHSIFFQVLIITSQFHEPSLLIELISDILVIAQENPLIIAMILHASYPAIWFFYAYFRTAEKIVDFNTVSNLQTLFAKMLYISLTLDHVSFEEEIYSVYALGIEKRVDVIPFIRSCLMKTIQFGKEPAKLDYKRFMQLIFTYLFVLPKSDCFNQNLELLKFIAMKYTDMIHIFQKPMQDDMFPLSIGVRVGAKGNFVDIDLVMAFYNFLKNVNIDLLNPHLNVKIFNSLTIGLLVSFLFCNVIRYEPNLSGDTMILFEKIFPPETCPSNNFCIFAYALYNSAITVQYWQGTFAKFVQKYAKHCGNYQTIILNDESAIFNDDKFNHFFVQTFGERSMYVNELIERYVAFISDKNLKSLIEQQKAISEIINLTSKKIDPSVVFALSAKEIAQSEVYIQKRLTEIAKIDSFDVSNKLPPSQIPEKTIFFNRHFHPYMTTNSISAFSEYNKWPLGKLFPQDLYFTNPDFIVAKCKITSHKSYSGLFLIDKQKIIVCGLVLHFDDIFTIIVRSEKSFEIFCKSGMMILVIIETLQVSLLKNIKNDIFAEPVLNEAISAFNYILWENFLNGKSFNIPENTPIFPEVTEQGKITEKILSALEFTYNQSLDKWTNMKSINLQSSLNLIIEWTERYVGKKLKNVSFTDDYQQGQMFVNSLLFKNKMKMKSEIMYVNSSFILDESGHLYLFTGELIRELPVSGISNTQMIGNKLICSGDYFDELFITDCTEPKSDKLIKSSQIRLISVIDEKKTIVLCETENCFSVLGPETPAIYNDEIFLPLYISDGRVISIDSSASAGIIAAINNSGKVLVSSIDGMCVLSSFNIDHRYTNIYVYDSGCIVITSPTAGISSFTLDGVLMAHIENCIPKFSACKIELDGQSSFLAAPFDGQLTILDARTLRTAKVLIYKRKMIDCTFTQSTKSLVCTMEGDVAIAASV